jgi:hypothetical protein
MTEEQLHGRLERARKVLHPVSEAARVEGVDARAFLVALGELVGQVFGHMHQEKASTAAQLEADLDQWIWVVKRECEVHRTCTAVHDATHEVIQ